MADLPPKIKDCKCDSINHPAYYNQGKVECIDAMESMLTKEEFKGYLKGSILKYLWRIGLKGSVKENLDKLKWYQDKLGRLI